MVDSDDGSDDDPSLLRLSDGRELSYVEAGDPSGRAVLHYEGSPGHIRFRERECETARRANVRIITVHRPGYRRSTPLPHYRLPTLPDDARQLADHLRIEQFAVMGHSAGGPAALACAWKLPERVTRVAVSGANAPLGFDGDTTGIGSDIATLFRLGRRAPRIVTPIVRIFGRKVAKNPRGFVEKTLQAAPPSERAYYSDPEVVDLVVEAATRQVRARMAGMGADIEALLAPWGFDPSTITTPVELWYGEDDASKIQHGRRLAELLPQASPRFLPGEAHEVFYTRFSEVLASVLE